MVLTASSQTQGTVFNWVATPAAGIRGASNSNAAVLNHKLISKIAGKVLYTVTPKLNNCVGPPVQKSIKVNPVPVSDAGDDGKICIGDSLKLGGAQIPGYSYSWTPSQGLNNPTHYNPTAKPTVTTNYQVFTSLNGCSSQDAVLITVSQKFTIDAGPDQIICRGEEVNLEASSSNDVSYTWSNGETKPKIAVTPNETTPFVVKGFYEGCNAVDTAVIFIKDIPHPTLFIPNSFTPNGDGHNESFKAYGDGIVEFEASIFDRWGELIYTWKDLNEGWNGQMVKGGESVLNDVYVYIIKVRNECKKNFEEARSGTITVTK